MIKTPQEVFDYQEAQKFELLYNENAIRERFEELYAAIEREKEKGERWTVEKASLELFGFLDKSQIGWTELSELIEDKTCLEIGTGMCGALVGWWWVKRRTLIDPLIKEYRRISLELFGKTWYTDDLEMHAQPAEIFIPELSGAIDGAIVCRNALDHCEAPMLILENIASYAKKGCYLILWTDLWHNNGEDEGHRNITKDKTDLKTKSRISDLKLFIDLITSERMAQPLNMVAMQGRSK